MSKTKEIKTDNKTIDLKVHRWQNLDTGEVVEAPTVTKKVGRQGFMITYLSAIINLIENLGNKKMQVVKYILTNMEKSNNTLITTTRELAEKSKVGHNTVLETLKILENAGIISRRTGVIMVHPDLVHRGGESKEKILIARFREFNPNKEKDWHYGEKGETQDDPPPPQKKHPNPIQYIHPNDQAVPRNQGVDTPQLTRV
jgi:hypothetical protein